MFLISLSLSLSLSLSFVTLHLHCYSEDPALWRGALANRHAGLLRLAVRPALLRGWRHH